MLLTKWLKIKGTGHSNLRKPTKGKSWYEPIRNTLEDRQRVVKYNSKRVATDILFLLQIL